MKISNTCSNQCFTGSNSYRRETNYYSRQPMSSKKKSLIGVGVIGASAFCFKKQLTVKNFNSIMDRTAKFIYKNGFNMTV